MRTISVTDLKARLAEALRGVQGGAEVVVTERGRPVARIVPHVASPDEDLERLVAAGLARPGAPLDPSFWEMPRAEDTGLVAAVLAEREEGW